MRQVLFRIPIPNPWFPEGFPIYGFGFMLFLAFITCTWIAGRRSRKEGVNPLYVQDLAIWIFVAGIIGARITYMIQYREFIKEPLIEFFQIWNGGLVFYGSAIGGVIGFLLAYRFIIQKHDLALWQLADIIAPSVAWGLMLGRVGCLCNGCCYGDVACPNCPQLHFPAHSPPALDLLVPSGWQTAAGFLMNDARQVTVVEPGSAAADAGLQKGDVLLRANDHDLRSYGDFWTYLKYDWPRGQNDLTLTVLRDGKEMTLPAFIPQTLGLNPTQIYEMVSMFLLFLFLNAYYPFRRRFGEVFALLVICYAIHRFLNEMLRNDTKPVAFDMTLSMNLSIVFLVIALPLFFWRRYGGRDAMMSESALPPKPAEASG